jgi:tetratricopeptide (TPR) repeat protein
MTKTPTITLSLCFFVLGVSLSIEAQNKVLSTPVSAPTESNNRVQDGLNGPVRRVRLETAQILVKEGKPVEGRRQLRGIATYDPRGRKIDTVAYPVEGDSLTGKEQYRYDEKGNIIEMIVRDVDGSVLSKENYEYEFDSLGNWKKMTTSVALYENGTVSYEPTEVSYRTIAYYYGAVEKLESGLTPDATPTTNRTPPTSTIKFAAGDSRVVESNGPAKAPVGSPVTDNQTRNDPKVSSSPGGSERQNKQPAEGFTLTSVGAITPAVPNTSSAANEKVSVKHSAEEEPKSAAVNPSERPDVTGNQTRNDVEKSSSPGGTGRQNKQLTEGVTLTSVGAITPAVPSTASAANEKASVKHSAEEERKSAAVNPSERPEKISERVISTASSSERKEIKTSKRDETSSTAALYQTGLTYLEMGAYGQAVETLNQVIKLNPNDGMAYAKLGFAYFGLRKYKEAVVGLNMAIGIKPEVVDAEAYYRLGYSYSELRKHKDAVDALKKALYATREEAINNDQASPGVPIWQIQYSLGLAYDNLGRYQEAIKELSEAVKLNPQLAEGYYVLGLAYLGRGDRSSAQKQQRILVSLNSALAKKLGEDVTASSFRQSLPCAGSIYFCR